MGVPDMRNMRGTCCKGWSHYPFPSSIFSPVSPWAHGSIVGVHFSSTFGSGQILIAPTPEAACYIVTVCHQIPIFGFPSATEFFVGGSRIIVTCKEAHERWCFLRLLLMGAPNKVTFDRLESSGFALDRVSPI